jgi:cellulose synthase/poly-beta-1,6-N-acetylglucosamine synthase-like glycosyltransferase
MTAVLAGVMWIIGLALFAMVAVLLVQVLASLWPSGTRRAVASKLDAPPYVVLMPAHDEAGIIADMVKATRETLTPAGRLLVIADNCTDDTAARARMAGAEVIERIDPLLRGKGYALAHGIASLKPNPPKVVLVVDADCLARPGAFAMLAEAANRLQRPVQGTYAMNARPGGGLKQRIAAFAWEFRVRVRAEGFRRLGLPCQLMGSGMAFPWPLLERISFATGHIVEDLKLGLEFAEQRAPPVYVPEAVVESSFPENEQGAQSQRKRWEHGHLAMIVSSAPVLLWRSFTRANAPLLLMTLDMCVPPLALLGMLLTANAVLAGALVWSALASAALGLLALSSVTLFGAVVLLGWCLAGRRWISIGELLAVPWYMVRKLPLYLGFLRKRETGWIRTKRD